MTLAGLAFEALVCVLLLMAVIMCWRVDRRLRALRNGQDGLVGTITGLNDAVERARATLSALDRATRDGGESLREEVDRFLSGEAELSAERLTTRPRREAPRVEEEDPETTRSRRRLNALKALR
jgi:hypothetical protein